MSTPIEIPHPAPSARADQKGGGAMRAGVYERITADIIAAMKRGAGAWRMPWHHDGAATDRPINALTLKPYRGLNILALWAAADANGHASGLWATYRQWTALGAQVRKGERATLGVVWKTIDSGGDEDDGAERGRARLFARGFSLFNVAQVEGYAAPESPVLPETDRIAHAELFAARLGIAIERGGERAYYQPSDDTVRLPPFARFCDAVSEMATRLHECAHATGARHRLDRDLSGRFGSHAYAMEECIAELAASFVLADLGVACRPRPDHAAYLASWLEVLKADPRAIFTAASKAQAVADWMHARQHCDAA
jgi:antirestriction protein ArdC